MCQEISPYVCQIKDWKIRDIIENYVNALETFKFFNHEFRNGRMLSYKDLRKICDFLWESKEGNHLIYRRVINPKKRKFEKAPKLTPNEDEVAFINNVGLLFHKFMVARELKYIIEYYENDSELFEESKIELAGNLKRIKILFERGIELLLKVLYYQENNIPLLTYFLEKKEEIAVTLRRDMSTILESLLGDQKIEHAYFEIGNFYYESGWAEQANSIMKIVLEINPEHQQAQKIMEACTEKLLH